MTNNRTKQAGFTLVEVLVAMLIFSLLSTATLSVLISTLRSKEQIAIKAEGLRQIAILQTLLKSDLSQTIPVQKTDDFGQFAPIIFSGGMAADNTVLSLSRTGWGNPGGIERRSDLQAVEYRMENGVLSRHVKSRFNAIDATPSFKQELLSGVESVKFTFYDGEFWQDNWLTGPPPQGVEGLPQLASLEIVLGDNKSLRHVFHIGVGE